MPEILDLLKPGNGVVQGLIPGDFLEEPVFSQQGLREPVGAVNKLVHVPALDTQFTLVHRTGLGGDGVDNAIIQHLQIKTAAAATICAGCENGLIVHKNFPFIPP
jgi:hypothetical protein